MPVIGRDLGHSFGTGPVLFDGLDLDLEAGSLTAVTGPSGSGKSTLLHIMAGWQRPSRGMIEIPGVDRVQWVFQNPHGVARRSAHDHVVLPLLARGFDRRSADSEAGRLLRAFGLNGVGRRPFRQLSGGESQRLMLARGIAAAPDLLLVDEPTAQLDAVTADTIVQTLGALAGRGAVVVVATHDPRTRDACDRHIDLGLCR
jgi:ABC-type lipoprotein export system ATPase subunit